MKTKIFSVFMVVALLVTLGLVTAAPASAQGAAGTMGTVTGPIGATINVTGGGWTTGETINYVIFNGACGAYPATNTLAVVAGNITGTITVPAVPEGAYTVIVNAATSGTVILGPSQYTVDYGGYSVVGESIVVIMQDGANADNLPFLDEAPLTFLWGPVDVGDDTDKALAAPIATTPAAVTADLDGDLNGASVVVPASPAGDYKIWVTDGVNLLNHPVTVGPNLKLTPNEAANGTSVTVTGTGFAKSIGFAVKNAKKIALVSGSTDATGSFSGTFTANTDNSGLLAAMDNSGDANGAGACLTLKAGASVSPNSGQAGDIVTVTGTDFTVTPALTGAGKIQIRVSNVIATITSTTIGGDPTNLKAWFTVKAEIPAATTAGVNEVAIWQDADDGLFDGDELKIASGTFTIGSRVVMLTPQTGPRGTKVTVSGGPLSPDETNTVQIKTSPFSDEQVLSTGSDGNLIPETFTVAKTAPVGQNLFGVEDSKGLTAGNMFIVSMPTITLSPTTGYTGTIATVIGEGFKPNSIVSVYVNEDPSTGDPVAVGTSGSDGKIRTTVKLEGDVNTPAQVIAKDNYDNSTVGVGVPAVEFTFTATGLEITPQEVPGGSYVMVTGTAFDPLAIVTVTLGTGVNPPALVPKEMVVTDANGNFTGEWYVPGLTEGSKVITAKTTGEINMTRTTFITITAGTTGTMVPVATAFASINGLYTKVWTFDAATQSWQVYDTAAGAPGTLENMARGQGYWVQVSQDCTLTYLADQYPLLTGWNLIGWLG